MKLGMIFFSPRYFSARARRLGALSGGLLLAALSLALVWEPAAAQTTAAPAALQSRPAVAAARAAEHAQPDSVTEEQLKEQLMRKPLYLRGGYLSDTLNFDEHGRLVGHSPVGSYTLGVIEIYKIKLSKHRLEMEGLRYGMHFLGALPSEEPTRAVDLVRITPKKKMVRITIDRERVEKPKKEKEKGKGGSWLPWGHKGEQQPPPGQRPEVSAADQTAPAVAAAAEKDEGPADEKSVTTTTSPAHALATLKDAVNQALAEGLDERMRAAMPAFWQRYYQAAAEKTDYRPKDPAVLRQDTVDRKARLLTQFAPKSNEYAQAKEVAGMALYHVVVGADGKPGEIAVARPIGFGLDENAVEAIRKARFEPATKDGKAVPVMLDLAVEFRIYSKLTDRAAPKTEETPSGPALPGPYSVPHP